LNIKEAENVNILNRKSLQSEATVLEAFDVDQQRDEETKAFAFTDGSRLLFPEQEKGVEGGRK
jgi:hypothetical protein